MGRIIKKMETTNQEIRIPPSTSSTEPPTPTTGTQEPKRGKERELVVTIVRHGQTEMNVAKIVQGQTNSDLTALGKSQAKMVGEKLKNRKFDFVMSSDLTRARDTCKLILEASEHHTANSLHEIELIRERDFGVLSRQPSKQVHSFLDSQSAPRDYRPEGGESLNDLQARAGSVFDNLSKFFLKKDLDSDELGLGEALLERRRLHVLMVSHGRFISELIGLVAKRMGSKRKKTKPRNCSLSKLRIRLDSIDDDKFCYKFLVFNDVGHLGA